MSAHPDLAPYFLEMEKLVEAQPDSVVAEIARGVYAMSPRPRVRHGAAQGELFAALRRPGGATDAGAQADWMFVIEPEIRSLETFSNVRSKMIAGPAFAASDHVSAPPFESLRLPLDSLFLGG